MKRWMMALLAMTACDDAATDPPPDAGADAQVADADPPQVDATPGDAGLPVLDSAVPVDARSPADQAVACAPTVTIAEEQITWRWWDPGAPPTARLAAEVIDAACVRLTAITDAPWLEAIVDPAGGLRLTATGPLPSGRHTAQVSIAANGVTLDTVEVQVQRLTRPENGRPKVLVIGADGVRSDAFVFADTPELDHWAAHGAFTTDARTQLTANTVSGPGWTSILTGGEPANHGVMGNDDLAARNPGWPTFLARARGMGLSTAAACQWLPILTSIIEPDATDWRGTGNQTVVTAVAAGELRTADHDVMFVHLDDPDHEGHAIGFSVDVPEYLAAIERVDADTNRLIEAIFDRPTIAEEDWLFIFTTDHGGRGQGHGPRDAEHQTIPLIVAGPAADPARLGASASHVAVHATVMAHLGAPPSPDWRLDAPAVGLAKESACFDAIDEDADGAVDCADPDCACPCLGDCPGMPLPEPTCPTADAGMAIGEAAIEGDTTGAEQRMLDCGGAGPEHSFEWVAPAADRYTFNTIGSSYDTVLSLRTACAEASRQCNADLYANRREDVPLSVVSRVHADLEAGERVFVVVDGEGEAASGPFVVNIHGQRGACGDADLHSAVGDAVAQGNNAAAPTRFDDACATAARDHTLHWTAPEAGVWRFDTLGSAVDTVLWVLAPTCEGPARACNDDADGLQSALELALEAGERVTVVVAGFRGRAGDWQLNITSAGD